MQRASDRNFQREIEDAYWPYRGQFGTPAAPELKYFQTGAVNMTLWNGTSWDQAVKSNGDGYLVGTSNSGSLFTPGLGDGKTDRSGRVVTVLGYEVCAEIQWGAWEAQSAAILKSADTLISFGVFWDTQNQDPATGIGKVYPSNPNDFGNGNDAANTGPPWIGSYLMEPEKNERFRIVTHRDYIVRLGDLTNGVEGTDVEGVPTYINWSNGRTLFLRNKKILTEPVTVTFNDDSLIADGNTRTVDNSLCGWLSSSDYANQTELTANVDVYVRTYYVDGVLESSMNKGFF